MSNLDILTSQNVSVQYEVAGVGNRILAFLIDFALFVVWALVILAVLSSINDDISKSIVYILMYLPVIFYYLIFEIFFNGQSIGKIALKIRVMKLDGTTPSVSAYLLRWAFILVDFMIGFGCLAVILISFTKNSQRLGDIVAGTTVVKLKKRTSLTELVPVQQNTEYVPVFSEVVALNDQDIQLLKKVLYKRMSTYDPELTLKMADYIKQKTGIQTKLSDFDLLHTVLKDYEYYALMQEA
jgi:uncharacterized RDD family membrane protein YckC